MIAVRRIWMGVLSVTGEVPFSDWTYNSTNEIARSGVRLPVCYQFQQQSVSDCQSLWSKAASLRATATRARFHAILNHNLNYVP